MLESYAAKDTVSAPEAATMHGLLNYAGGFVVGHCLKPAARQLQVCSQVHQIQSSYRACAMIHAGSLTECDHEKFAS